MSVLLRALPGPSSLLTPYTLPKPPGPLQWRPPPPWGWEPPKYLPSYYCQLLAMNSPSNRPPHPLSMWNTEPLTPEHPGRTSPSPTTCSHPVNWFFYLVSYASSLAQMELSTHTIITVYRFHMDEFIESLKSTCLTPKSILVMPSLSPWTGTEQGTLGSPDMQGPS